MMKVKFLLAAMSFILLFASVNLVAQDDPDPLIPDTVRILGPIQIPDISVGDSFSVPIYIWHDEVMGGFSMGFTFDYDYVVIQSTDLTGSILGPIQQNFWNVLFYPEDREVLIGWADFTFTNPLQPVESDTAVFLCNLNMKVLEGATPTRVTVDSIFVPPAGNLVLSVVDTANPGGEGLSISPQFSGTTVGLDVTELESPTLPESFSINQNVPNPFNPNTSIDFAVPKTAHVTVEVYNALGQKVVTLVDETLKAGFKRVEWDGTDSGGNSVASGVYFYRMTSDSFSETKKMMLLK
jgi:hypothetical protein